MANKMAIFYVYMYLDLDNVPFYIGKGKKNRYAVRGHLYKDHSNKLLKNKIRKVGVDNIDIQFLYKNLTEEQAFYLEEYYIAGYGRRDLGLGPLCNLTNGGDGSSGYIISEEHKRKIGKSNRGHKVSDETRRKIGEANKSKRRTEEAKQNISKIHKGKKLSKEHKRKIGDAMKGKKHTEETKRKISEKNRDKFVGEKNPMYGKPSPMKGKKHTEETKRKISETAKLRWRKY